VEVVTSAFCHAPSTKSNLGQKNSPPTYFTSFPTI
jgi:hypothetical protein